MSDLVQRLLDAIKANRKRIVVLGDVMVDRWVHGHLAQCQDDCPKFVQEEVVAVPGGAGNAYRCLSKWPDMSASLYGQAQNDCPVKTRYVEGERIVFRADNDGPRPRGIGLQWARDLALEMVRCAGGVLLSDYDKGFLTPEFIREVATVCQERGIPCVADAKRAPEVYSGCILKGNLDWYGRHDIPIEIDQVITCGHLQPGVNGTGEGVTGPNVKCLNHVGAGDCFAAHLTLALTYGFTLKEAAALAHSAGRVYVQHPHNQPPAPTQIAADLSSVT